MHVVWGSPKILIAKRSAGRLLVFARNVLVRREEEISNGTRSLTYHAGGNGAISGTHLRYVAVDLGRLSDWVKDIIRG